MVLSNEIMVISCKKLFSNKKRFEWFSNKNGFEKEIMLNYEYMIRNRAEENELYKQPIVYSILKDKKSWDIFCYERTKWMLEDRLTWKMSIWIWWHINKELELSLNPIRTSLYESLDEKLSIPKNKISIKPIWYINSEKDKVSKVHFWVLYLVELNSRDVLNNENINWKFISISEIENNYDDLEEWSKISFKELKNI